jgi:hypothetical protein
MHIPCLSYYYPLLVFVSGNPHPRNGTMASSSTTNSTQSAQPYFYLCNEVTPICPVEATTLGYYPNKGINTFFAIAFGAAAVVTFVVGTWKKTWSYMVFITMGCSLELAGEFYYCFSLYYPPISPSYYLRRSCLSITTLYLPRYPHHPILFIIIIIIPSKPPPKKGKRKRSLFNFTL